MIIEVKAEEVGEGVKQLVHEKWMWCGNCWDRQYFSSTDKKTWKCTTCQTIRQTEKKIGE